MGSSQSSPSSSSDESDEDDKIGEVSINHDFWIKIIKYPIYYTLPLTLFLIYFSWQRSYHNRWRILQRLSARRTCDPNCKSGRIVQRRRWCETLFTPKPWKMHSRQKSFYLFQEFFRSICLYLSWRKLHMPNQLDIR